MMKPAIYALSDFEQFARETLPKYWFDYFSKAADDEVTLRENAEAFKRYQVIPRVLRDVSNVDTATSILGHSISFPVCISPTAAHAAAHLDGEVGTARGAMSLKIGYTMSIFATRTLDEVADAAPDCLRFLQLSIFRRRDVLDSLVKWAERRDFKALVVTIDQPVVGKRPRTKRGTTGSVDSLLYPCKIVQAVLPSGDDLECDPAATWKDVQSLKSQTRLPIIVKGILSAEDAILAVEAGVDGILVSNHGGRQLDSVPATIDVLSDVVKAVNGRCEVYLDGGIRRGTDVLKALALGARVVFIGRPAIYALAYNGEEGVRQMLEILKTEFSSAMALSGCRSVDEVRTSIKIKDRSTSSHL